MSGEPDMKEGLMGVIQHEDDAHQIHVNWDNGRFLALIPGLDTYKILTDSELRKCKLEKLRIS